VEQVVRAGTPLNFIKFRSGKGFLLHVAQTFDIAQPYLKAFHLAENMWRPGRDSKGWKVLDPRQKADFLPVTAEGLGISEADGVIEGVQIVGNTDHASPPPLIRRFPPRLIDDVVALQRFFA
jgi:hypothetical protein